MRALLLLISFLLAALPARAGHPAWRSLKVGMSATDARRLIGEPLLRTGARGFETWTYDAGAEILLYGATSVVGWTAPADLVLPLRSEDIWSRQPAGTYYATMHSILPRPSKRRTLQPTEAPAATVPPPAPETSYESFLRS